MRRCFRYDQSRFLLVLVVAALMPAAPDTSPADPGRVHVTGLCRFCNVPRCTTSVRTCRPVEVPELPGRSAGTAMRRTGCPWIGCPRTLQCEFLRGGGLDSGAATEGGDDGGSSISTERMSASGGGVDGGGCDAQPSRSSQTSGGSVGMKELLVQANAGNATAMYLVRTFPRSSIPYPPVSFPCPAARMTPFHRNLPRSIDPPLNRACLPRSEAA